MLINVTQTIYDSNQPEPKAILVGIDIENIKWDETETKAPKIKFEFHLNDPAERSYILKVIYSRGKKTAPTIVQKLESLTGQVLNINFDHYINEKIKAKEDKKTK